MAADGGEMKTQRFLSALTLGNLVLLLCAVSGHSLFASERLGVLRGTALELVDGRGRVRASIQVLPAGRSKNGDAYKETVLLRLITERGRPSVKIGASESSAGLSFAGPTGTQNTYVILEAKDKSSALKLREETGKERVLTP